MSTSYYRSYQTLERRFNNLGFFRMLRELWVIPVVLMALHVSRPNPLDYGVYVRASRDLLAGNPIYYSDIPHGIYPFIYPPFAAVIGIPFALLDNATGAQLFNAIGGICIYAILRRLGLGAFLSGLIGTIAFNYAFPLWNTLEFGQINIILMALIILGPLKDRRRHSLSGVGIGIAAGIKLTPLIFIAQLFFAKQWKQLGYAFASLAGTWLIGLIANPTDTWEFITRLAGGDSGINGGLQYVTNQSIIGNWVRLTKHHADKLPLTGLILAAIVGMLGLVAAWIWQRRGQTLLSVCLVAFAGLMASPISWGHHFVWLIPLLYVVGMGWQERNPFRSLRKHQIEVRQPLLVVIIGTILVIWTWRAPYYYLPHNEEFSYTSQQLVTDGMTALLTICWFLAAIIVPTRRNYAHRAPRTTIDNQLNQFYRTDGFPTTPNNDVTSR